MKKFLFIALLALLQVPLPGDTSWKEAVAQFKAGVKPTKPATGGDVYPDISEMLDAMFQCKPVTHISAGGTDIYIGDTEVYVIQGKVIDPETQNWNLAVTADGVFEWETGKKTGIKIKRDNKEIVNYLWYLLDPAAYITGLYSAYLSNPAGCDVLPGKGGNWKEFRFKQPLEDGFEAVYVTPKPLWYHGFRFKTPEGVVKEFIISDPEQIQKIPDGVKARMRGIHFKDSPLTLARHLEYP